MRPTKTLAAVALLALFSSGCAMQHITNLTPRQLPRSGNNLYRFEAAWQNRQQSLKKETLRGYVVIGTDIYPMRPVVIVSNHWETFIAVPPGKDIVNYHYKFDFEYNSVPAPRNNSKLSRAFQLKLLSD